MPLNLSKVYCVLQANNCLFTNTLVSQNAELESYLLLCHEPSSIYSVNKNYNASQTQILYAFFCFPCEQVPKKSKQPA